MGDGAKSTRSKILTVQLKVMDWHTDGTCGLLDSFATK